MLTTDFVPGAPAWIELGSSEWAIAATFYRRTLGWQYQALGVPMDGYGLFSHEGRTVAAHVPRRGSAAWTVCFATPDADATARAVSGAGGAVQEAPSDLFGFGRRARLADPHRAEFGVWQAMERPGLDAVSSVGALAWTELHAHRADTAAAFYRTVFSWDVVTIPGAPGEFVRPAGTGAGRLFGAVVADTHTYWRPYFEVADVDQAAAAAPVVAEPYDLDGVGRIAVLVDPFGATFGVMRSVTS